ncbi:hypothetical protein MY04_1222 [Flammeovirga sp. MY04]|uniref:hypothetical protein n=1 Tax=Flammeovirga sp. MY04 TaxID=1191459 RepID=UPI0013052E7B|nr:hypothetical protein [Flammeovirga sp. MY04]ANQ48599.2 hypothetical protein MY04_1222 [Flammeovirga sp. MY04]
MKPFIKRKVIMMKNSKRASFFVLSVIFIIFQSCGLRSDGGKSVDGKIYTMLYFNTDKDLTEFKSNLKLLFGEPDTFKNNDTELIWNSIDYHEFKDVKLIVGYPTYYRNVNGKRVLDSYGVDYVFIDRDGNDLLDKDLESFKIIKGHLEKEIEIFWGE